MVRVKLGSGYSSGRSVASRSGRSAVLYITPNKHDIASQLEHIVHVDLENVDLVNVDLEIDFSQYRQIALPSRRRLPSRHLPSRRFFTKWVYQVHQTPLSNMTNCKLFAEKLCNLKGYLA